MKIISWNVNSVRARINYVNELLQTEKPDFLCLQETKIIDSEFPIKNFSCLWLATFQLLTVPHRCSLARHENCNNQSHRNSQH